MTNQIEMKAKELPEEIESIARMMTYGTISYHRQVGGLSGFCELVRGRLLAIAASLRASQEVAAPIEESVTKPIGCIDRHEQRFASAKTHKIESLIAKGWTAVFASPAVAPVAVSVKGLEQLAREIAVTMVDAIHGYTMEFAPSPAAHRDEYDRAENAARYALSSNIPATKGEDAGAWWIEDREDDALIVAPHWNFGKTCVARRPKLMTNDEWRPIAEQIIAGQAALAALSAQDTDGVAAAPGKKCPYCGDGLGSYNCFCTGRSPA